MANDSGYNWIVKTVDQPFQAEIALSESSASNLTKVLCEMIPMLMGIHKSKENAKSSLELLNEVVLALCMNRDGIYAINRDVSALDVKFESATCCVNARVWIEGTLTLRKGLLRDSFQLQGIFAWNGAVGSHKNEVMEQQMETKEQASVQTSKAAATMETKEQASVQTSKPAARAHREWSCCHKPQGARGCHSKCKKGRVCYFHSGKLQLKFK